MKPLRFFLVTDLHYFDTSFKASGSAYERRSRTDQKCIAETGAIIDAGFSRLADDKETEIILIPGDLVYRGEYQSHVGLREKLYKLRENGKRIYLITARHDYSENPVEFDGENEIPVKGMPREELRDFYREFGFDGVVMTDWIVGMMAGKKDKYPWPNAARIAAAGNDLTMPGGKGDVNAILKGLQQRSARKRLSRKQLQINVTRIYRLAKYLTQAK